MRRPDRNKELPALPDLRIAVVSEGLWCQIMHRAPLVRKDPILAMLHDEYMPAYGFWPNGHRQGIYLGDPRRP